MAVTAKEVIQRFLERRNGVLNTEYRVTRWPDEENRVSKDVDAIAESKGQPALAIEHTQVMTFQNQVREDHWFTTSIGPIQDQLGHRYDPLQIRLVFNYVRGEGWPKEAVETIRNWLDANLPTVSMTKGGRIGPEFDIPEIGLVRVYKRDNTQHPGLLVSRTVPTNVSFADEGLEIMDRALDHKYGELAQYRQGGLRSLLLLDARDIALTNEIEQYKFYFRSCLTKPRRDLDEVWVADVWEGLKDSSVDFFCFRADKDLMKSANPEGFWFGTDYDNYWRGLIDREDQDKGKKG